jgi:hypothetical protein
MPALAAFCILIAWGASTNWIPYRDACAPPRCLYQVGESHSSIYTAIYYQLLGAKHWFVQMLPMHVDEYDFPDRETIFYTHNLNIGAFIVYFCALLGFKTIMAPAIISAAGFSFGIYFAHRYAEATTNSALVAGWFAFFMATDFLYNLSFGLDLIRAWHWLGIFGAAFAVVGRVRPVLLVLSCLVNFLIGYEFALVAMCIAISTAVAFSENWNAAARKTSIIIGVFSVLFAIRQIQIIGAMGVDVWRHDFLYTFGLKLPAEFRWFNIPSESEIAAWYADHKMGRGGTSAFNLHQRLDWITLSSILPTWTGIVVLLPLLAVGGIASVQLRKFDPESSRGTRALVSLCLGIVVGTTPFFDHVWGYFFRSGFPLLTAPIFLALTLAVVALIKCAERYHAVRFVSVLALGIWVTQQAVNFRRAHPRATPELTSIEPYKFRIR